MTGSLNDLENRQRLRLAQLQAMSDEEFAEEVRQHRSWKWQGNKLKQHLKAHGDALEALLGYKVENATLIELADSLRATPDIVRTGIDASSGLPEYAFVRELGGDDIIVALTRDGFNRTVFPSQLSIYLRVRADMVEVTERVRQLEQKS